MLTKHDLVELGDWLEGQLRRLEDEDGAEPVQFMHAKRAWELVYDRAFGTNLFEGLDDF